MFKVLINKKNPSKEIKFKFNMIIKVLFLKKFLKFQLNSL